MSQTQQNITTEIPSFLKQLARLIAQGFYQVEDALIIDLLVRKPCVKEKDLEELLKFDLKMLRARLATLKNEKMLQLRLRMETGLDGKAQKVNYYFINYKSLVNVIKYKLDHLRKRLETLERDATHRASFVCTTCSKSFTDFEAGELFDAMTLQFRCTFCFQLVVEDESSGPKQDSRFILARFNEQMKVVYDLLAQAEGLRLAPELLEPEPPRSTNDIGSNDNNGTRDRAGFWSGEATRVKGTSDTRIDIKFGEAKPKTEEDRKERPIWLMESTIGDQSTSPSINQSTKDGMMETLATSSGSNSRAQKEDIMNVLLAFEKKRSTQKAVKIESDSDSDSDVKGRQKAINTNDHFGMSSNNADQVETMETDDDDNDGDENSDVPLVTVGTQKIPITEINDEVIENMTIAEKETYNQQFQDFYANVFD